MRRLTKSTIDKIQAPSPASNGRATQTIVRDEALQGFGLLVGSGGTKSFFVERRIKGRVKRISIGRYGHLTPQQARKIAQDLLGQIAMGKDPAQEKKSQEARQVTLQHAFEDYLRSRKDLKPGTIDNYRKCMDGCLADWLPKRLIDIDKDMVNVRHSKIGRSAPARANNTMRVLRAVFNHAIAKYEDSNGRPVLSVNPVDRLSQTRAWYQIERRRTLLSPSDIKIWHQGTLELGEEVSRDFLQFLLYTGLRKMEAASLRWDAVDQTGGFLTIGDTKNREPHTLPITRQIGEILEARQVAANTSEWVFPSPKRAGHLREPRGALRQITERQGISFTLHDLRRTFITIAEGLDIPHYALKRLLNHRDPNDVTAGYIVSNVERLRRPMQQISDQIEEYIEAGK